MYRIRRNSQLIRTSQSSSNLIHPCTRGSGPGRPAWLGGSQKRPEPGADRWLHSGTCRHQASRRWHSRSTSAKSAKFFEVLHAFQQQGAIYKLFQGSMTGLCRAGCVALQAQTPLPLTSLSCNRKSRRQEELDGERESPKVLTEVSEVRLDAVSSPQV